MAGISQTTLVYYREDLGSLIDDRARLAVGRGRINEATREKVCTFAEELGYTPISIACTLRTKHSVNITSVVFYQRLIIRSHLTPKNLRTVEKMILNARYVLQLAS